MSDELRIDPELHAESVRWVCRALASEGALNLMRPRELAELAERLVVIAEANEAPVEDLVAWIHRQGSEERSAARWREYCHARP